MEKGLFRELYKRACVLDMKDCPPQALSGFLHGYLSVYSMVRVYPWLEKDFGDPYVIHERVREIARFVEPLTANEHLSADVRAGHVVDLMDAYQLYSDLSFLDTALDAAYNILTPWGSGKVVLPCRTPNICRLLCNCYYFTGEKENAILAGGLITEALGFTRKVGRDKLVAWWDAICFYEDAVGAMELSAEERERLAEERTRLSVTVKQAEEEIVNDFVESGSVDIYAFSTVFHILSKYEFVIHDEWYGKKE